MRILVVDNYDSFVFNLVQYLGQLDVAADVWRNDDDRLTAPGGLAAAAASYDGVLLSPGPGNPKGAGVTMDLIRECAQQRTPAFGVCLGHQALGEVFGATVDRAPELLHGKTSQVWHDGTGVLRGLPSPFTATRYHSLTVLPETLPAELIATAHTDSGVIMAMRHRELPLHGVQFHPESVKTEGGHRMLANWLAECGEAPAEDLLARAETQMSTALAR
jgi:para-aminobenzoate synthetase component 2